MGLLIEWIGVWEGAEIHNSHSVCIKLTALLPLDSVDWGEMDHSVPFRLHIKKNKTSYNLKSLAK